MAGFAKVGKRISALPRFAAPAFAPSVHEVNEESVARESWFRLVKKPPVATVQPSPEPDHNSRFEKERREDFERQAPLFASPGVRAAAPQMHD
jgi:hypothetical protein